MEEGFCAAIWKPERAIAISLATMLAKLRERQASRRVRRAETKGPVAHIVDLRRFQV